MKPPTKRKMYHKRRKKEKADQRKNDKTENTQTNRPTRLASKRKSNRRPYHRLPNKQFSKYNNNRLQELTNPLNSYTHGLQDWWHTYCTAIQYHTDQQKLWNKEQTGNDKANDNLTLLQKYANEYETSSSEEEDEDKEAEKQHLDEEHYFLDDSTMVSTADVDEEYLKFLEITHKHREELKLKRTEEDF